MDADPGSSAPGSLWVPGPQEEEDTLHSVSQSSTLGPWGAPAPLFFGAQLSFHLLYNRVFWLEAKCPSQVTAMKIGNLINFVV